MEGRSTRHAKTLHKAMLEAHKAFQDAHAQYQSAFDLAGDTQLNADAAMALRLKGRAYAQALSEYMDATMAWLAFVDAQLHTKPQGRADSD